MRAILAFLVVFNMAVPVVPAAQLPGNAVTYEQTPSDDADVVPFNAVDAGYFLTAGLVGASLGFADVNPMLTAGVLAGSVLGWGAWRTAQIRGPSAARAVAADKHYHHSAKGPYAF